MLITAAAPPQLEKFYFPIERMDDEKRTVTALCFTSPRVRGDKFNLKYTTLKRSAQAYMKMPCIREMHQPKAAGNATHLHFDDANQRIEMTLEVTDDQAWEKCKKGTYRGLSIGGLPLIVRGSDVEDFDWVETSLVDRPKDPGALFMAISRAEVGDVLVYAPTIELEEDATEEQLSLARAQLTEQLERFEGLDVDGETHIARFDHNQPRDNHGMWTIIGGERVSIHGHDVDHSHIDEAKTRFGLSDEAHSALKKAHDDGHIKTDDHLYRTIAHAHAASGSHSMAGNGKLHAVTSSHINEGIDTHRHGGSWESRWASHAFENAPKLKHGITVSHALGLHQLQKGDTVHSPSDGKSSTISGRVTKVLKNHVDFEYGLPGGATHGMRVKKSDLARNGFVRRPGESGDTLHHIEVARAEMAELLRAESELDIEELQYQAEALIAVARRADEEDQEEAVNQVLERFMDLLHGEADTAIQRGGQGRNSWRTQPRNNHGEWTDGAGNLNVAHVQHVMRHEGIDEDHHHEHVKKLITEGKLKNRRDVLDHIDAIHDGRLKGDKGKEETDKKEGQEKTGSKPTEGKEPEKTSKSGDDEPKGWKGHLKKFGKDFLHKFLVGVRKGKESVGRVEDGLDAEEVLEHLVQRLFDGLEQANDRSVDAALCAALDVLDGEVSDEEVERLLTSSEAPTRENLEGGDGNAALDHLRELFFESDWDGNRDELIAALKAALLEVNRGEGVVSFAAKPQALQRFEEVQGSVTRLEGELSIARSEAQAANQQRDAAISRAEVAEEKSTTLGSENTRLSTENEQLRAMDDTKPPVQFTGGSIVRTFAANEILNPISTARAQIETLREEHQELQRSLLKETDQAKREKGSERLMVIDQEIAQLSRLA